MAVSSLRGPRCAGMVAVLVCALAAGEARAQSRGPEPSLLPPNQQAPLPIAPRPGSPGVTIIAPGGETVTSPPPQGPSAQAAIPAGQVALALSARFGREPPPINSGLHWRVYTDKPDTTGLFRLVKEDRNASPTIALPPGSYIVHVSFGLAGLAKRVQLRAETVREVFELPAGGVRLEGRVGDAKIAPGQISFDIYKGSQFEQGDKRPMVDRLPSGDVAILPEGLYHVVSSYGDGNAVMRSDLRVQAGKLTDTTIVHRAAKITLKLVSEAGGEALASTAWSVLTPSGDLIKESISAFPAVILAEGDYVVIARNDNKVYNREFKVEAGVDREIEVVAR